MTRSTPAIVTELRGQHIEDLHPDLLALYEACFSGPPWHETDEDVAAYASRIRSWADLDSFTGLVVRGQTGELVGAAYGWRGPAEARGVALPGVTAAMPFHVADLMVHPAARRHGLGRMLLHRLVTGRRPALLLTHPDASSRRLYDAAGWLVAGVVDLPEVGSHVVYTLD